MDNTFHKIITEIDEGAVIIERTLMGRSNFCRYRFTLAHEVSHWLIHRPFHSPTNKQYECRTANQSYIACRSADIENKKHINRDDTDWQEWQADSLTAAMLMPRNTFTDACMKISSELGIRFSQLQSAKIEKCVAYTFVKKTGGIVSGISYRCFDTIEKFGHLPSNIRIIKSVGSNFSLYI